MRINVLLVVVVIVVSFGCASPTILNDRQPTPVPPAERTPEPLVDDFEERLRSVRTGDFEYVYAFRRKDDGAFDSEDKKYLKENSSPHTNQWVLTGDKKAVIAGSNYFFTQENLDALKKRFKIEDYSREKTQTKTEQNSNSNR